jgi:PAS domain S-box-containing protein
MAVRPSPVLPRIALPAAAQEITADLLGSLLDQSQDCIKLLGPTGNLDYMNANGLCIMEIDDFSLVAGKAWWELWPAESQHIVREAIDQAAAGHHARFEAFCPTGKGSPRWWEVGVSPVRDAAGQLVGIVSISRDISERVEARERLVTLAAEMRHRLRNAFAISGSLARTSARSQPAHSAFAADLADRFAHLAVAQSRLVDRAEGGDSLRSLIPALTDAFGGGDGVLSIEDLPDVMVAEQPMRAIALLLGELCTNSVKYGALGGDGTVSITGAMAGRTLALHWSERSGLPKAEAPTRKGDGMELMRRIVEAHAGRLEFDWRPDGLEVTATIDID